jgi:RIO-like serine/threonine protein kinase
MYIAKRYFKQNVFREENFIMRRMGYEVRWAKDPKYNNTISLFPYRETKNLKEVVLEREKFKLAMYKTILELDKTHKQGFIHMDVKPINIVVDSYK